MELLLNLAWLLLALPACWLWRSSRSGRGCHRSTSLQCLLALAAALVMLFPVVSATDDLHAMRAEMEESPASKRSVRQSGNEKASVWNNHPQDPPALLSVPWSFCATNEHADLSPAVSSTMPDAPSPLTAGRAPPASYFA
jgi:hypothetical protein